MSGKFADRIHKFSLSSNKFNGNLSVSEIAADDESNNNQSKFVSKVAIESNLRRSQNGHLNYCKVEHIAFMARPIAIDLSNSRHQELTSLVRLVFDLSPNHGHLIVLSNVLRKSSLNRQYM